MTSDLMPSSEPSHSPASNEEQNKTQIVANVNTVAEPVTPANNSSDNPSEGQSEGNALNRQQPIPPPSEPMQYRAIGLVRGCYCASSEQFTQGMLVTSDGVELNAVLLGRIMSLVKNHLDLEKEHLWVVYPRTRQENDQLHLQIVGVWEPENLAKNFPDDDEDVDSEQLEAPKNTTEKKSSENPESLIPSSEIPDGGFSVRGEVVYQSHDAKNLVVKIKQAPRKPTDKPKYFKLKLQGVLVTKAVGKFWDFNVKREADALVVENAEAIADLPKKRRPPFKPGGPRGGGSRKPFPPRRNGETPRPIKKRGDESAPISKPISKAPAPKPVKRPKPPES
ncbi:hypothetical protein [Richelia sinica]|nr:hypothetical protein [Richelia sinica]MBD2664105.1 hypothetical protein [Richelia sinica FACHB-800]